MVLSFSITTMQYSSDAVVTWGEIPFSPGKAKGELEINNIKFSENPP